MRGISDICNKLKEVTIDNDIYIMCIENGYSFKLKDSQYVFKILCLDDNGWNIYLEPIKDEILVITHRETNLIYSKLECIVEEVNYEFYYDNDDIVYGLMNELFDQLDEISNNFLDKIDKIMRKNLNYIITFRSRNNAIPTINIRYSVSSNSFIYSTKNFFYGDYVYNDLLKINSIYSKIIESLNKQIEPSNCIF